MFKLIGGDRQEYGPVTAEVLRQWILEGRANGQSLAQAEGTTDWKPLTAFPEFADVLKVQANVAAAEAQARPASALPPDVLTRDWQVDLGRCVSLGVELFQRNFGLLFGGVVVYFGIEMALGLLGMIPLLGWMFSILNMVIVGPLIGGVYELFLRTIRGQPASVDTVFNGFRERFLHLFLVNLVIGLFTFLAALPGIALAVAGGFWISSTEPPTVMSLGLLSAGVVLAILPAIYLGVSWVFALPLVMDQGLDFWTAMETSRRVVGRHWWWTLGLLTVVGLLNFVGFLFCCIGVLFTMPVAFAALLYAYEAIFNKPAPPA
jgi:uncharacterized membrane protein